MRRNLKTIAALALGMTLAAAPALAFQADAFNEWGQPAGAVDIQTPEGAPSVTAFDEWHRTELAGGAKGGGMLPLNRPAQLTGNQAANEWNLEDTAR